MKPVESPFRQLAGGYPPRRSGMGPVAQQVFKTCAVV